MAQDVLFDVIAKRRSVRKFKESKVEGNDLKGLTDFIAQVRPMFKDIRTEMKIIDADKTKGMARTNSIQFIVFFSEPKGEYLVNAGFMLQQVDLYLSAHGMGSCYQGLAKTTKEIAAPSGMHYVIMLSFGWPAEDLHRKDTAEFKRASLSTISEVKGNDDIMESVRLAPSAMNAQSWYFTGDKGVVNVYYQKALVGDDMRQIDAGIAMCHLMVAAEHAGKKVTFSKDAAAEKDAPKKREYLVTAHLS